ncbi:MAG: protein jag [Clostridia bacterium]|nr:protein jag [Clostridia bacterium]
MKKEITVSAKTVEEALEKAAAELGATSVDAIEYTVLEEAKKGFLGIGGTPAKISASYEAVLFGKNAAVDFIERLVADMKLDATVSVREGDNGDTVISIDGESAGVLIGHHGDTLDSLQYLANLAANKKVDGEKKEYCKITIDIENYRAKREETLRTLARHMASKVVRYKKSVMLEPMNPYERRIIHSEIQGIEGVSTNSIGSENNRKIVIYLDEKKSND